MAIMRVGPVRSTPGSAVRARPVLGRAAQGLAIAGAFLLGIAIALSLPGVARAADAEPTPGVAGVADPEPARIAAVPDEYDGPHDGDFSVDAARGVLANDPGQGLTAELWTEPVYGSVTLAVDGGFVYARSEAVGSDSFAYLASDAAGGVSEPVRVTLRFANRAPSCGPLRPLEVEPGSSVEVDLSDLCGDADGDAVTFDYQRPDVPGGTIWDADASGHVHFLPPPDWTGTATVVFTVRDGLDASMPVVLAIRVAAD